MGDNVLSGSCKAILERHVEMKGRRAVAAEIGRSLSTLSQILNDKYPTSTEQIEARIMKIYGEDGKVCCPVLGNMDPAQCAANHARAQKITKAGNPATIRLYAACRKCDFRG